MIFFLWNEAIFPFEVHYSMHTSLLNFVCIWGDRPFVFVPEGVTDSWPDVDMNRRQKQQMNWISHVWLFWICYLWSATCIKLGLVCKVLISHSMKANTKWSVGGGRMWLSKKGRHTLWIPTKVSEATTICTLLFCCGSHRVTTTVHETTMHCILLVQVWRTIHYHELVSVNKYTLPNK